MCCRDLLQLHSVINKDVHVHCIMLMQCNDVCPEGSGWDSLITANTREARSIHITWMPDTPSSLYVVQYRLRNTQVYTSSLEVRGPVACVHDK